MSSIDRYGRPDARTTLVIALHGAAANRKTWLPLGGALPEGFELWAPDLPGHGARRDEPFTIEASLATVAALLREAGPRRPIVAGDSLGGYLALAAGARFGDGVAGIVAGGCTWTMTGAAGMLARASDLPAALFERIAGPRFAARAFEALIRRLIAPPALADDVVRAGLRPEARSESIRELRGFDVPATVKQIAVPLTFVNGRFDWPTRAGERAYTKLARDGAAIVAPHSGHGVGLFAPDVFARAIVMTRDRAQANR